MNKIKRINIKNYKAKSWLDRYPSGNVNLTEYFKSSQWYTQIKDNDKYNILNSLSKCNDMLSKELDKKTNIFPFPKHVFNAFKLAPKNIKVVIIGMDPYINSMKVNQKDGTSRLIPQACGYSFSVPKGFSMPPSLNNIFKNMYKYKHINNMPESGDLTWLVKQGVMLLNYSLTVLEKQTNSHTHIWKDFTNSTIEHLCNTQKNIIFVLWGANAQNTIKIIDKYKKNNHYIIKSKHPSPQAAIYKSNNTDNPDFMDKDHFGEINKILKSHNKKLINFNDLI